MVLYICIEEKSNQLKSLLPLQSSSFQILFLTFYLPLLL